MKVLLVPLSATAWMQGPGRRVTYLAQAMKKAGLSVATCAALDGNFTPLADITNYFLPVPVPLGLPEQLGKYVLPLAQKLGITRRKTIHSFEEVLFLTGALNKDYFLQCIEAVRKAVQDFKPDFIYSEFNLAAIAAGKLEGIKVLTSYSFPVRFSYASSPQFSKGVNEVLAQLGMPHVLSSLQLFLWADARIVPSCYVLEPIEEKHTYFVGPLFEKEEEVKAQENPDKILAYVGTGTFAPSKAVDILSKSFKGWPYEVYIAGSGLQEGVLENIHIVENFDFKSLLSQSFFFLHQGDQNSMMEAIKYSVPQMICPGRVFERKYNAESMRKAGTGIIIKDSNFNEYAVREAAEALIKNRNYKYCSEKLWQEMQELEGTGKIIQVMEEMASGK